MPMPCSAEMLPLHGADDLVDDLIHLMLDIARRRAGAGGDVQIAVADMAVEGGNAVRPTLMQRLPAALGEFADAADGQADIVVHE